MKIKILGLEKQIERSDYYPYPVYRLVFQFNDLKDSTFVSFVDDELIPLNADSCLHDDFEEYETDGDSDNVFDSYYEKQNEVYLYRRQILEMANRKYSLKLILGRDEK